MSPYVLTTVQAFTIQTDCEFFSIYRRVCTSSFHFQISAASLQNLFVVFVISFVSQPNQKPISLLGVYGQCKHFSYVRLFVSMCEKVTSNFGISFPANVTIISAGRGAGTGFGLFTGGKIIRAVIGLVLRLVARRIDGLSHDAPLFRRI